MEADCQFIASIFTLLKQPQDLIANPSTNPIDNEHQHISFQQIARENVMPILLTA